ncbi:MAG: hypothetical protein MJY42_01990 [Bacteroidales bacterium]|nr:hypothetical protein [Bacteroidales bacterium]
MKVFEQYRVAGHSFRLGIPDSAGLRGCLDGRYAPFVDRSGEDALFTLETVDELPDTAGKCIYDVPTEDGETVIRMFETGDGYMCEMAVDHRAGVCGRMYMSGDFSQARLKIGSRRLGDALFCINNSLMLLYAFATFDKGTLEMHASVVVNGGRSYLFLGRSGTGKSTHSRLWLDNIPGSVLLNDDNPIIRVTDQGVTAYGSPWSGKTPCYRNESAPVGAFVLIRQSPGNSISRMNIFQAYATLYSSCSGLKTDKVMADGLHATMEKTVALVPFHLLDCRPDREAAELCYKTICR